MKSNWDLIQEAVIARASHLVLQDAAAQFERGEFPVLHMHECMQQAMRELEALLKSEKEKRHARDC